MKHIGIHNNRKVAVMFRQVPNEPEHCLVVYTEALPEDTRMAVNNCVESANGQNSASLADAAANHKTVNGEGLLNTLHVGNFMNKVPASEVFLTPNEATRVSLAEVNKAMGDMQPAPTTAPAQSSTPGALSDEQIASNLRNQAATMQKEADRLNAEADELHPLPKRGRGRPPKVETTEAPAE